MAGFLALKREKRELEGKLEALEAKIQAARAELESLKRELGAAHEVLKTLDGEARKLELETVIIDHQIARLEAEVAKIDQTDDIADDELSQMLAEKQEFESKAEEAQRGIQEIEERSRSGEQELRELGARLESSKAENSNVARSLATLISSQAVKQERRDSTELDLRRLSGETKEVVNRLEVNRAEKGAIQVGWASSSGRSWKPRPGSISCCGWFRKVKRSWPATSRNLRTNENRWRSWRNVCAGCTGSARNAMEDRGRIEIEKTRLESDLEHLERSCQDEFHAPLAEILTGIPRTIGSATTWKCLSSTTSSGNGSKHSEPSTCARWKSTRNWTSGFSF